MASGAVKRKHEEVECDPSDQTASDQRQSILNISMVKLRSQGAMSRRVDPSLRRSVLIFNTLRHIECQLRQEGVTLNTGNKPLLPSLQPITDLDLDLRPSPPASPAPSVASYPAVTSGPTVSPEDSDRTLHRLEAMEISPCGSPPSVSPPGVSDRTLSQPSLAMDTSEQSNASSTVHSNTSSINPAASRPLVASPSLQTLPPVSSLAMPSSLAGSSSLPMTTPLPPADTLLSDRPQADRSLSDPRYFQDSLLGCDKLTVASFMSMFELDASGAPPSAAYHSVSYAATSQSLPSFGSEFFHSLSYSSTSQALPSFGSEFTEALSDLDLTPLDLDLFMPLTSKLTPLSAEELIHSLPASDPFPGVTQNMSPCTHKNELLGEELDHVMQVLRVGGT